MPNGWGRNPQTPVCDTFELQSTSLLKHVSQFRHFRILTIGLSPLLNEFLVTCHHQATASDLTFSDIFALTKNSSFEVFDDVIVCDLPPPIKNLGYAYGLEDFEHKMEMEWKKIAGMKYGKIIFHSIAPCHTSVQTPFQLLRFFCF